MKTLKIAALGVAAFGFAALPVAGVMAAEATLKHTDTINLNIDSTCTLGTLEGGAYTGTDATTHGNGNYTNPKNTSQTGLGGWSGDTLAITMQSGTSSDNIGSTTFTVRCNNANGYELKAKAAATNLLKGGSSAVIPGAAPAADTSYWAFKLSDASEGGMGIAGSYDSFINVPTTATTVASKGAAGNVNAGETVKVTYAAGVSKTQESGSYTGSVEYTLVEK